MAKNNKQPIEATPILQEIVEDEPLFETQAYSSPQPDAGSEVTVTKPIGIGGPVPIVAPKHNTIQLQPIVVPLAVVPYMSQDSSILRTEGGSPASPYTQGEATQLEPIDDGKKAVKKNLRARARVSSLVSFLLSVITVVPFILCYFDVTVGGVNFHDFNALALICAWAQHLLPFSFTLDFLGIVAMGMAMLCALLSLIGLIIGKYPKPLLSIFLFIGFGCLAAQMIVAIVKNEFDPMQNIIMIVVVALTFIAFILSIVFSALLNKWEDKDDENESKEI